MARPTLAQPGSPGVETGYRALNAYFDRVVVLTLQRATARHAQLAAALQGLRYELVYGQDKGDLALPDLVARGVYDPRRARKLHRMSREMNLGEIACVLSHLAIWRQVSAGPHRRVLVLEDDAVPAEEIADVGTTLAELPDTWELLYLGYDRNDVVTRRRRADRLAYIALGALGLGKFSAREAANLLPRPHSRRLRRAGLHDQTHAYAITPSAAGRLARFQQPIALAADSGLTRVILRGEVEAYVADPRVFYQSGDPSLIHAPDALGTAAPAGSDTPSGGAPRPAAR